MAVKLSERSFAYAKRLIDEGRAAVDEMGEWSEHQPSTQQENEFIETFGFDDYGRWYLGEDDDYSKDEKSRYEFPYGDFERAHRCGVIAAEVRAAQRKYDDIEVAAAHLHGMLDELK
ncbi:hypothetical protein NE235_26165 [Actinoallomurus spadix]|uniref:Uncharacterized protein n=1 Tax=Actinoallomurus spadix TaxID=79912 RepID=A0ABN0WXV0_9ACTN|nr:hypothetical protein [Actinoallomurus spadix]MCO5989600.1 hypothetical protein [Actinoallomurus spadix]